MLGPGSQKNHQQHFPLLQKNEQNQKTNDTIGACSDGEYGLFQFSGWLHIKWFALVKHVFLFFYLIRMVQSDLVQAEMDCFFPAEGGDGKYYRHRCLKNICIWLHNIVGLVPRFLIKDFTNLCLVFLVLGFVSCISVLAALYSRERRKTVRRSGFRRFVLSLTVVNSMAFELFIAFFWYYAIIMSVHWRVQPNKQLSSGFVTRSILFAAVLAILMFLEVVLHVLSLYYICADRSEDSFLLANYNPTSPTDSILEVMKHPGLPRHHMSTPKMNVSPQQMTVYDDSYLMRTNDSGNVSRDSNFGRHSPYVCAGASGNYSPNYALNPANYNVSQNGEIEFNGRKVVPVAFVDVNTTRTSNYEHIRDDGLNMTSRPQPRQQPPHPDDSDITYEVV